MTTTAPVTFINVIEVDPEHCDDVVAALREGLDEVISRRPGFVSATVHVSTDRQRVVNLATWARAEDAAATAQDPAAGRYAARVAALGQPRPGVFTTAHTCSA